MLNDLIKSNEDIIENFNKNFANIIEKEKDKTFNNIIEKIQNKNFNFTDLMLINDCDNEEINKLKREILNKTEFAQPAILLHSYLNYKKFIKEKFNNNEKSYINNKNLYFFGPSLGEIISLVCANSIDLNKAGSLLYKRGKFMQESCPLGKGAMLNVIGDIYKNINLFNKFIENNKNEEINLSSIMSKRLLLLSGASDSIEKSKIFYKENSIACRKLVVSAAFHSNLMSDGSKKFKEYLFEESENIFFGFPEVNIISTISPEFVYQRRDLNELNEEEFNRKIKEMLVEQFTKKVDLMSCVENYSKFIADSEELQKDDYELYDIIKRKNVNINDFL